MLVYFLLMLARTGSSVYALYEEPYFFTGSATNQFLLNDIEDSFIDDESSGEEANGSRQKLILVSEEPLTSPPCLPRTPWVEAVTHQKNLRKVMFNQREVLTVDDLISNKVQLSGRLATDRYMQKKNGTSLKLLQYLGGCKQVIAGELFYLIFEAVETVSCQNANCTTSTATEVECRARVHISNTALWNPFYVSCHPPEYYQLPWRGINTQTRAA